MEMENELNREEAIRLENDFLKLKLMIEKGAQFVSTEASNQLPANVENEFLKYIQEFERQAENPVQIKVYDKIGRPYFRPVTDLSDEEMDTAWQELSDYLLTQGVSLEACSPNVNARELYRFTVEELFDVEIDDIRIPGMIHGFIYDEFHPDIIYDNGILAVDCMLEIFRAGPMLSMERFRSYDLRLNEHVFLAVAQFETLLNRFKEAYEDIVVREVSINDCLVNENCTKVNGMYRITGVSCGVEFPHEGTWEVELGREKEGGSWLAFDLRVEGINF